MISVLLLLIFVPLVVSFFAVPVFEISVAVLLLVPIEAFLIRSFSQVSCIALVILNLGALYFFFNRREEKPSLRELSANISWVVFFLLCLAFCLRWPDFMPMGERLRDYALLSSVIQYPLEAKEPWMSGAVLNYYIYWYRFGAFLSKVGDIPIWDMYHILQSCTFSLYIAVLVRIFQVLGNFKIGSSVFAGVLIAFGSNIQGIVYFWIKDDNWWGPSRVIKGAINEFPAWSYLLGDLHPHYVSLPVIPFLLLGAYQFATRSEYPNRLMGLLSLTFIFAPLWIYNCNAWEVPLWIIFAATVMGIGLIGWMGKEARFSYPIIFNLRTGVFAGIAVLSAISLYFSSRNLAPAGDPFHFVRDPILLTTAAEMFRHWGFPISLITIATLLGLSGEIALLAAVMLSLSLFVQPCIVFLFLLLTFHIIRARKALSADAFSIRSIFLEALPAASLIFIIIPEIVFLDDPYGGESERMNTIFKAYTVAWGFLHLSALLLSKRIWDTFDFPQRIKEFPGFVPLAALCPVLLGFFVRTSDIRASKDFHITPISEGLSQLDTQYPGAAEAIRVLRNAQEGVTLEAQDNPYSLTTHVSTLASKEAYLGWANHINLLVRNYREVTRRENVTKDIYGASDCLRAQQIASQEGISYIVWGPIEQKQFPSVNASMFSCLQSIVSTNSYQIFRTK